MFTWKLAKTWRQLTGVPEAELSESESGPPTWPEVDFSAEGAEASLRTAWICYQELLTQEDAVPEAAPQALDAFVKQFVATFESWQPTEMPADPDARADSSEGAERRGVVVGCAGGHPTLVISTFAEQLRSGVTTWDKRELNEADAAATQGESGNDNLDLIHALMIVTRSHHNRMIFGYYGGLQTLMQYMKVLVERMSALSASTELSFVHCLLAHCVSITANHCEAEARAARMAEGKPTPPTGGAVALLLLHWGGLATLIDLVGMLRGPGVGSSGGLELLILRTLRSALAAHPKLQHQLANSHALPTLLRGIGPSLAEGKDLEEFELQIERLRLLRDAIFLDVVCTEEVVRLGGFMRFTALLRWAAWTFAPEAGRVGVGTQLHSPEEELHHWNPQAAEVCRVLCSFATERGSEVPGRKLRGVGAGDVAGGYWELVTHRLVWVLLDVFAEDGSPADTLFLFTQRSSALQSYIVAIFRQILGTSPLLLPSFREKDAWKVLFGPCFFYFQLPPRAQGGGLELSAKVMADLEAITNTPRGMRGKSGKTGAGHAHSFSNTPREGLMAGRPSGSSSFSFSSSVGPAGIPSRSFLGGGSIREKLVVMVGEEVKELPSSPAAESLRLEVITLLEAAASGEKVESNEEEVGALLEALVQTAVLPRVAPTLARCLHRLLQLAPGPTIAALDDMEGGLLLTHVINRQQAAQREGEGEQWWPSRLALFSLLESYLGASEPGRSAAACDWATTNTLFNHVREEGARAFALPLILSLLRAPTRSTWSSVGLFIDYAKTLRAANSARDLPLLLNLLQGVRQVVEEDPPLYQPLFVEGDCCAQLVEVMEEPDYPPPQLRHLCLEVLSTLTRLLSGNKASKDSFRSLVAPGYPRVATLLLACHDGVPSRECVMGAVEVMMERPWEGEGEVDMVIQNDDAIPLLFTLLRHCPDPLRTEGLELFEQLLVCSVANRASCVRTSLLQLLLEWVASEDHLPTQMRVGRVLERVGSHSMSGKDLRTVFALLRSLDTGCRPRHASLLLRTLRAMVKDDGPTVFCHMDGIQSGLHLIAPLRFPSRGFTFTAWLRTEGFPPPDHPPMCLFRLATEEGVGGRGYTMLLHRHQITVHANGAKEHTCVFPFQMPLHRWTFVAITHSTGQMLAGPGALKLYVDEACVDSVKLPYPTIKTGDPLHDCSIAAGHAPDSLPFRGQVGPLYVFQDSLSGAQVDALFSLGSGYMYSFSPGEFGAVAETFLGAAQRLPEEVEGLGAKILCSYNALASATPLLFDTSPAARSDQSAGADAVARGGVQLCVRQRVGDVIHCVGGIGVLFPLFTQLDQPVEGGVEGGEEVDPHLVLDVIGLLTAVLAGNHASQVYMLNMSGFAAFGFLLRRLHPHHLSLKFVLAMENLVGTVAHPQDVSLADALVTEAVSRLFLDPLVWIHSPFSVQHELYGSLFRQVDKDTERFRHLCGFTQMLDIVRTYYSGTGGGYQGANKPTPLEMGKLRLAVLSIAERMLCEGFLLHEVKALVSYCETAKDVAACEDVVGLIVGLLSRKVRLASLVQHVYALGGCSAFLSLLTKPQESLCLLGLRLLGCILVATPHDKRAGKDPPSGSPLPAHQRSMIERVALAPLFGAIEEALTSHPWTPHLRDTLMDVLTGVSSVRRKPSDGTFSLPQLLPILLRKVAPCPKEDRVEVLERVVDLLEKQAANRELVAQEPTWQEGLLHLLTNPTGGAGGQEESLVYRCFSLVHSHAVVHMKAGWRPLERTLHFVAMMGGGVGVGVVRTLLADVLHHLVSTEEGGVVLQQPCKDNCLYLLQMVDEVAIRDCTYHNPMLSPEAEVGEEEGEWRPEWGEAQPVAETGSHPGSPRESDPEAHLRFSSLPTTPHPSIFSPLPRPTRGWGAPKQAEAEEDPGVSMWRLYDSVWLLLCAMKGVSTEGRRGVAHPPTDLPPPTFGQRARAVVESLNGPALEMMGGHSGRYHHNDKAIKMRGEKCPRVVFRLVLLYIYEAELDRAKKFCSLFLKLLPSLMECDSDSLRNRLHNLLWTMEGSKRKVSVDRMPLLAHVIVGTVEGSHSMLATSLSGGEISSSLKGILQEDRINLARKESYRHLLASHSQRVQEVSDLRQEVAHLRSTEAQQGRALREKRALLLHQICQEDGTRRAAVRLRYEAEQQATARHWMQMYRDLTSERGSWSSGALTAVARWKLDKTEDPQRRRMRLRPNYRFDPSLLNPPVEDRQGGAVEGGEDRNEHVRTLLLRGWRGSRGDGREGAEEGTEEGEGEVEGEEWLPSISISDRTISMVDSELMTSLHKSTSVSGEGEEKVMAASDCILVTAKRKVAGRLEVMGKHLMFHSQWVVEGNGGCSMFNGEGKLREGGGGGGGMTTSPRFSTRILAVDGAVRKDTDLDADVKQHRKWAGALLKEIRITRFLLHPSALELFFTSAVPPVFFNLPSPQSAKDMAAALVALARRAAPERGRGGEVVVVDRKNALEMAERLKGAWCRREISTFAYLMKLNTLSGRSFNDLMQYPVFPWVVADYTSQELHLDNPDTFRDLSKPMGALDAKRFEAFQERYLSFTDPDIPSFFYGSHYSTAGIVLFYLLRLEPFSSLNRTLQGGKFDHADRLFYSMQSTYANCLRNSSDVKELIPEFYYQSAFLSNDNEYHLGVKQDGKVLGDVILPPWAHGSPDLFVRRCRDALECEYVSERVHCWVDLIFGFKQRGQAAVESANLFYHLTYEGAVDLQSIQDPFERGAMEDQIAEFGQTPMQLFRKPHPPRGPPPSSLSRPLVWAPDAFALTSRCLPLAAPSVATGPHAALRVGAEPAAVMFIGVADGKAVVVSRDQMMTVRNTSSAQVSFGGGTAPGFSFGDPVVSRRIGTPFSGAFQVSPHCFGMMEGQHPYLLTAGHWDNSFQCVSTVDGRTVRSICQHNDVVTCCAVSSDGTRVVTGSRDTTVMVWSVESMEVSEGRGLVYGERFRLDRMVSDKPRAVLCGHDDSVTTVVVKSEVDLVVSGSTDGTVIAHTLHAGRYLWSKPHPGGPQHPIQHLVVSREGLIVLYSPIDVMLHVYTVNGKWLASVEEPEAINAMALSSDDEFVVTGGNSGLVRVRWLHSLELRRVLDGNDIPITSLALTEQDCILVGVEDGQVLVYAVDTGAFAKNRASVS